MNTYCTTSATNLLSRQLLTLVGRKASMGCIATALGEGSCGLFRVKGIDDRRLIGVR